MDSGPICLFSLESDQGLECGESTHNVSMFDGFSTGGICDLLVTGSMFCIKV